MPATPCKGCENRSADCHVSCERYLSYAEENKKKKEERKKNEDAEAYLQERSSKNKAKYLKETKR